jgi:long-chain acyl-CoA synthetase
MAALNARLEQPEQVRRWAVLPYDLTVEGGELTANLKLRRAVVAERLGDVIASLYDQAPTPAGRSRR